MGGGERRQGMREKMFTKTFLHTIVQMMPVLSSYYALITRNRVISIDTSYVGKATKLIGY
jgi:hypothetical protein